MVVVGGQAPKAIRSVECYDFEEQRWYQVAELPTRRCRAGGGPPVAIPPTTIQGFNKIFYKFMVDGFYFLFWRFQGWYT